MRSTTTTTNQRRIIGGNYSDKSQITTSQHHRKGYNFKAYTGEEREVAEEQLVDRSNGAPRRGNW